jgi:hypothetical protein
VLPLGDDGLLGQSGVIDLRKGFGRRRRLHLHPCPRLP